MLWGSLDEDGSGLVDVGEFLRGMLGEMDEARVGLVHRSWLRMDPGRVGDVTYDTVRHFYNPALSLDPATGTVDCLAVARVLQTVTIFSRQKIFFEIFTKFVLKAHFSAASVTPRVARMARADLNMELNWRIFTV